LLIEILSFLQRWILRAVFVLAVHEVARPSKSTRPTAVSSYTCAHRADIEAALEIYRRPSVYDGDPRTTEACAEATQAVLETFDEQQEGKDVSMDAESRLKIFFATIQQKLNGTLGEYITSYYAGVR